MKKLLLLCAATILSAQDQEWGPRPPADFEIMKQFFSGSWPEPFDVRGWKLDVESGGGISGDRYAETFMIHMVAPEGSGYLHEYWDKLLIFGPPMNAILSNCADKECAPPPERKRAYYPVADGSPYLESDADGNVWSHQKVIEYGEWHKGGICIISRGSWSSFGGFSFGGDGNPVETKPEDCYQKSEIVSLVKPGRGPRLDDVDPITLPVEDNNDQ